MKQYNVYYDGGHSWLEVNLKELEKLDIVSDISHYSYISNDNKKVYLEEDCDLPLFLKTKYPFDDELGIDFGKFRLNEIHVEYENNPIRDYSQYNICF